MFYFAYGSNMDEKQMNNRCPESSLVGIATLEGYRLGFTRYAQSRNGGVADIVSAPDSSVWGLVYRLTRQDLDLLDSFEGKGKAYDRMTVQVRFIDGRMVEAETYFVIDKQSNFKPGEEYLRLLLGRGEES